MPTREEMRSLAEEIVGTYADRMATIGELRETVKLDLLESRRNIEELRDRRIAIGKQMKADLARDAANRKHEVGSMLNGFGQALATMDKEMRGDLAKGVADRKREVSIMKSDVGALLRGFSAELKDIRSELAGGRDEWQILTATMQAHRGVPAVELKTAIEEPVEEVAEITPKTATLSDRVFEYLANHPNGRKMTELAQEFGIARIQMAKVVRSLMNENKVRKQELLYYAT